MPSLSPLLIGSLALLALLLLLLLLHRRRRATTYERLPFLFTRGEQAFLLALQQAVAGRALIFGKVRVADVLTPRRQLPRQNWWQAFNKIAAKHFDFVLCDRQDLSVLCVIELNDASHDRPERRARDAFLEAACAEAGLPLLQVRARRSYRRAKLLEQLAPYLGPR